MQQVMVRHGYAETADGVRIAYQVSGELFDGVLDSRETQTLLSLISEKATPHGFKGCFRVTIDRPSLVGSLHLIQCPTLILVGENDTHYLAEAELLRRKIANARRVIMPGVVHPMSTQDPEAFENEILRFF